MKLLPLMLLPVCLAANASVIHVDVAGTMTGGFNVGESISISLDLDTAMPTTGGPSPEIATAYYAFAVNGPNWIDASFTVGSAHFDASVSRDSDEGLLLRDAELGAPRDEWHEYYIGRQLTPITPLTNGYADALLGGFRIETFLFNGGDFIHGLGKEQIFDLVGSSLGTGRLDFSYQLVHEYDGARGYNHETAITLSNLSNGTFNITSARATKVPEPATLALFVIGLLAFAIPRGRAKKTADCR
jgi:hypothetical protein